MTTASKPPARPDSADRPEPRRATRNVPPLVWLIGALLVAWFVVMAVQRGGTHVTPQGGTAPQPRADTSYMPPGAATGDAPATPGGTVTSPD